MLLTHSLPCGKTANRIVNLFSRSHAESGDPRPWQTTDYTYVDGADADNDNDGYRDPCATAATTADDIGDHNPNKRCRIGPVKELGDANTGQRNSCTVPDLAELTIIDMLQSINRTYDNLPKCPQKNDLETAYNELCQEKYFTGKLQRMYPFDRWKSCRKIRHPLNVVKV